MEFALENRALSAHRNLPNLFSGADCLESASCTEFPGPIANFSARCTTYTSTALNRNPVVIHGQK